MAPRNVDLLDEVYEHWGRGDWEFLPGFYSEEGFEWGWSADFPGVAGVQRDTQTPNERLRTWLSPWERWTCEVEGYLEAGDTVVVLARYRGRGKGSGVDVDVEGAHVWQFRDGRAVRMEVFADRRSALESAGLD